MSRAGLVGLLLVLALAAYIAIGSMSVSNHQCEVCIEYHGRSQCRTVAAATVELARDGAIQNACAFIAGGVTEGMACHRQTPTSEHCQ